MKRFVSEYANYERKRVFDVKNAVKSVQSERVREISEVENACKTGIITEREAVKKIAEIGGEYMPQVGVPQAWYSGGGIIVCAMHINDDGEYVALDEEDGWVGLYADAFTDGEEFPFVEMEGCFEVNDPVTRTWYKLLTEEYDAYCERYGYTPYYKEKDGE